MNKIRYSVRDRIESEENGNNDMVVVANLKIDNLEKAIIEIVSSGNIGKIGTYIGRVKQIYGDNYFSFSGIIRK